MTVPEDYTEVDRTLAFPTKNPQEIIVPIHNDDVVEKMEHFFVDLVLLMSSTNVIINPARTTVFIRSEDRMYSN